MCFELVSVGCERNRRRWGSDSCERAAAHAKAADVIDVSKATRDTVFPERLQNANRGSSTFLMLQCHIKLPEHMKKLDPEKIDATLLIPAEERKVKVLIGKLEELDQVTKKLQRSDAIIRSTRAFLDSVLEDYSDSSERLDPNIRIVKYPFFASGILMVQDGHEIMLTTI